jgi:hypothetical protein
MATTALAFDDDVVGYSCREAVGVDIRSERPSR